MSSTNCCFSRAENSWVLTWQEYYLILVPLFVSFISFTVPWKGGGGGGGLIRRRGLIWKGGGSGLNSIYLFRKKRYPFRIASIEKSYPFNTVGVLNENGKKFILIKIRINCLPFSFRKLKWNSNETLDCSHVPYFSFQLWEANLDALDPDDLMEK